MSRRLRLPVGLAQVGMGSALAMRKAEAHGPPPSLFEVVHRGVEVADPSGELGVADLLAPVEDADEPITGHRDIELELAELKGRIDPQDEDPAVMMAVAVATYLAFRRDEIDNDREDLLRLAARAEYNDRPPDNVRSWLDEQGVAV
jgi:hypothetical protein